MHEIGSSATIGNNSISPETDGAFVIPTAMIRKDGYILAWEFVASKNGTIQIQVRKFDKYSVRTRENEGQRGRLRALAGVCHVHESYF